MGGSAEQRPHTLDNSYFIKVRHVSFTAPPLSRPPAKILSHHVTLGRFSFLCVCERSCLTSACLVERVCIYFDFWIFYIYLIFLLTDFYIEQRSRHARGRRMLMYFHQCGSALCMERHSDCTRSSFSPTIKYEKRLPSSLFIYHLQEITSLYNFTNRTP